MATQHDDRGRIGERLASGRSADVFALDERRVVKRFRLGTPADVAIHEAARTRAARAAGAPAPEVHDVVQIEQCPAIVVERVHGVPMLDALLTSRIAPGTLGRNLAQLHLRLHALPGTGLPRQHASLRVRLDRIDDGLRTRAIAILDRLPADAQLCHGDFHPGNVLMGASGEVVIDWYDATSGTPAADVAQTTLLLLHAHAPGLESSAAVERMRSVVHDAYLDAYRGVTPIPAHELAAWRVVMAAARLPVTGDPGERNALVGSIGRNLQLVER
jgi:Ser/Thr protein kinase RdoA (MazF antagonist)